MPPARPQACDLEVGGREPDAFGGAQVWITMTSGARELRESRGSSVQGKEEAPRSLSFPILLFCRLPRNGLHAPL